MAGIRRRLWTRAGMTMARSEHLCRLGQSGQQALDSLADGRTGGGFGPLCASRFACIPAWTGMEGRGRP